MLPFAITAVLLVATQAAATTLHYSAFCGNTHHKSVVFTKFKAKQCVCFDAGVYEHLNETTPCIPTVFRLEHKQCVEMPRGTTVLTKLQGIGSNSWNDVKFKGCSGKGSSRRVKRADEAEAPKGGEESKGMDEIDEDFSSQGTEIGHELMRTQMADYVETVIAKLTGLHGDGSAGGGGGGGGGGSGVRHKYPVIKLMDYTKQIMQKTCTVVNPDFFDLALNSFINLQLETYHIKEPYLGYSAFKRIEQAMTRCLQRATPHIFVTAEANETSGGQEMCDNHMPTKSSNRTVIFSGTEDERIFDIVIPPSVSAELEPGKIAEPLIEAVWKMLVSAHSYCYEYFSDYFNDHHAYTVALLPLFSNQIQDVWLNEVDGKKGYDLSDPVKTKLYGGLLGDVISVLKDVDYCVGASRAVSPYPWFMYRPQRDASSSWNKRRKRGINQEDSDEIQFATGKLVTEDNFLVHECRNTAEIREYCKVDF